MPEQIQAQIDHDPLADVLELISADEIEDRLQRKDDDQDDGDLIQQLGVVLREDRVDEILQRVRTGQAQQAADHDRDHGNAEAPEMRAQVHHQAAELIPVGGRHSVFTAHNFLA